MEIGEAEMELEEEQQMIKDDLHIFQQRLQPEEVDEQQEQSQLKAESDALIAKENDLLSRLRGKVATQNLSLRQRRRMRKTTIVPGKSTSTMMPCQH